MGRWMFPLHHHIQLQNFPQTPVYLPETSYKSVGAKESKEGDETTGGGLAWGGGCSPSLTKDLVMFTDNQDPVNLIAVDMKTGEQVASMPVIDELPEGTQVSVENSAIVYDDGEGTVSTIVCNCIHAFYTRRDHFIALSQPAHIINILIALY